MSRKKNLNIQSLLNDNLKKIEGFSDYKSALELFWKGNTRKATDRVGAFIEKNYQSESRFYFYRLWIECLRYDSDYTSLVALKEHLHLRSSEEGYEADYLGLTGLIFLALDEFEGASLITLACDSSVDSVYLQEFYHEYAIRNCELGKVHIPFAGTEVEVSDYFSYRSLVGSLLETNYSEDVSLVLKSLKKAYGDCPLYFAGKIGENVRNGSVKKALTVCDKLLSQFPQNDEFKKLKASLCTLQGDNKEALKITFSLLKKEISADEVQLANWCFLDNAEQGHKNTVASLKNFEKALEVSEPELNENKKVWLTYVSDSVYSEITKDRQSKYGVKLHLNEESAKGDWVVFVRKGQGEHSARVVGIFEVAEKLRAKIGVTENAFLESVQIFEKSIELDLHEVDRDQTSELFKSFGVNPVVQLDQAGLDVIFDEIEDQLIFDDGIVSEMQKRWTKTS